MKMKDVILMMIWRRIMTMTMAAMLMIMIMMVGGKFGGQ